MSHPTGFQRAITSALALSAAVLLATVGLPHRHDGSVAAHSANNCRVCKIHEGYSAVPLASPDVRGLPALLELAEFVPSESPRAVRTTRQSSPRAPPILS